MKNRYKIILSGRKVYKEIEMPMEVAKLTVGTGVNCDVRLRKEIFFEQFELLFKCENNEWQMFCSDNVYITSDDISKLLTKKLVHGEEMYLRYHHSDGDIFKISFMIDFEFEKNDYERCIDISSVDELYIGGTDRCQIYLDNPYIGKDFIVIQKDANGYKLKERNTKYGVYINDRKRTGDILLRNSDFIALANYSFCIKGKYLYTSKKSNAVINGLKVYDVSNSRSTQKYPMFNRNTRIKSVIDTEKIDIQHPSAAPQKPKGNIIMQLMPAVAMLAVTVLVRGNMSKGSSNGSFIILSVCTMGVGILTTILGIISSRKEYKEDSQTRVEKYNTYIGEKEQEIQKERQKEAQLLEEQYYSIDEEIKMVEEFSGKLFDREFKDEDFLEIRLGTGKKKSLKEIGFKKQEKYDCEDDLIRIPEEMSKKYEYIQNMPITLKLKDKNSIGVVGPRKDLYDMMKNITLDLAIRHYYTDLNLFYIMKEEDAEKFRWLRYLPHLYNDELGIRNIVCDLDSKNHLFEYLYKEFSKRVLTKTNYPNIVVFVYGDMGIKRHPISNFMECSGTYGITFIFLEEYLEQLPTGCSDIIKLSDNQTGVVVSTEDSNKKEDFVYKQVSDGIVEKIVNKLAPVYCQEVSLEGSLTKNITLFELLDILSAEDIRLNENWETSQVYKTMAAPLGVNAKNEVVCLDLNEKNHGPHGLVAGTTGSGKSEILQSYILSVATKFHPYEVGFMIIDFKGGGMVNQFRKLPHLLGAITNIDGKEIERSLKSIKAELQKRQRWFSEAEVNHIDKYIKKYKNGEVRNPLPHLIIIVDEFAELKAEQPEFMKELISAARIGRSLGVHLILATQKPSGVVDAQIWSNSKFKLCLKVQSKEDSNEVLKTPLAAEIKEPGRAYLQVGNNEIFELFQSAYSGASAVMDDSSDNKEFVINQLNFSGMKKMVYQKKKNKENVANSKNQLDAIVDYIAEFCEKTNLKKLPDICLPPVPEVIEFTNARKRDCEEVYATLGLLDDPDNQIQQTLDINISAQNYMIIGSAQSGKTNILQTIIRSLAENYSPEEVNMYMIDFGSMILRNFSELNHCGGVVCANDDEKLKNLFRLLRTEIAYRKEKLAQMGVSSFIAYKEAGMRDLPQIVVLVDNVTSLRELYFQDEDLMLPLCRDGIAVGISFIVANSQTSGIGYRYLNNFEGRITLFCNESSEYSMMFEGCRQKPSNIPGRCLIQLNKHIYECQSYLSFKGEKEFERVQEIKKFVGEQNEVYFGAKAKIIPEIPKNLNSTYVMNNYPDYLASGKMILGLDYTNVSPKELDLTAGGMLALAGKRDRGLDDFAKYFVESMMSPVLGSAELYIMDDMFRKWGEYEYHDNVAMYASTVDYVSSMITEIETRLQLRYDTSVLDPTALADEPWLVLVIESNEAIAGISADKKVVASFKNIVNKYRTMKVLVLFTNIENANIAFNAPEVMKMLKETKRFLVFEDIANIKLTDISVNTVRKYSKALDVNDAFYINDNELFKLKTVKN